MGKVKNRMVDLALSQVGTHEVGGNNKGEKIVMYQTATWLVPGPWSWCAAFMCWILKEALTPELAAELNLNRAKLLCRDASAFGWIKWAKEHGIYITDEKEPAKKGDIVVFDFSHIGIVIEDQLPGKDYIATVEGNTNGKGERDSESGDGVWKKLRKTNLVRAYIRLA